MDDSTRFSALHKIKSINKFIGYDQQLLDENKIDQVYDMVCYAGYFHQVNILKLSIKAGSFEKWHSIWKST